MLIKNNNCLPGDRVHLAPEARNPGATDEQGGRHASPVVALAGHGRGADHEGFAGVHGPPGDASAMASDPGGLPALHASTLHHAHLPGAYCLWGFNLIIITDYLWRSIS